jgi:hypothetical protein
VISSNKWYEPNILSIFTSLGPKFEIKRVYSPVILGLNVVKKSFENSFVLTILPFGSRIDSLRVTFIDSSPECNITDTGCVISLTCNVASTDSEALTIVSLKLCFRA